jgi:hypothetical protein
MAASSPNSTTEIQAQVTSLQAIFAAIINPAVARYVELVGSSMAAPLCLDLNEVARTNAWKVEFMLSGLKDTQAYETTAAAVRAYRILARTLINHMTIVIGARVANSIIRDTVQQLEPAQIQLVETYHLVPDTALSGLRR